MPGFDAIREEETITSVHRGGVEGITTIGSAACCARSRFAVVDAEVIIQPTFHRYRGSVGHSGGGDADKEGGGEDLVSQHVGRGMIDDDDDDKELALILFGLEYYEHALEVS